MKFLTRVPGYMLFLTPEEAVFAGRDGSVERMKLIGANPKLRFETLDKQPGISNYFIGNDPTKWRTNVPNYGRVALREVYPGIDLIFYGKERQLEYDWLIAPGADPKQIRVKWEGANQISKTTTGDIVLSAALRETKPRILQERKSIEGGYLVRGNEVGFAVANYDAAKPLVIDPVLLYSTYLGGNGEEQGSGIAVDGAGNAYLTGYTSSTNFPNVSPLQATFGGGFDGTDAFVTKINAAGSALVYSTYLGGASNDYGYGVAVDGAGNALVTGRTQSINFPTVNPLQASYGGGNFDVFVAKINSAGSTLLYSTYLGGTGSDDGYGIAADGAGNAYITGDTFSTNFPTANPIQNNNAGAFNVFVTKINATGSNLLYSTYLGGSGGDSGSAIAADSSGNVYVTGSTTSTNFPTANSLQANYGGHGDAFVTKIDASGSALVYSTYLGGRGAEECYGIAVDGAGNAYVTGTTSSTDFPTANPLQVSNAGLGDVFVTKISPSGSALIYSTYLGGNNTEYGQGIAVDSGGNAYVTGYTLSTNFPTANPLQATFGGGDDAFVAKIDAAGSTLIYSTYLGGSGSDIGYGIAVDALGNAYVTGLTSSANFATANPLQGSSAGGDAFVSVIGTTLGISIATPATLPQGTVGSLYSQTLAASGGLTPYSWSLTSGALPEGLSISNSGMITGTPTAIGTSVFSLRVMDVASSSATQTFSLTIAPLVSSLAITTNPALPDGTLGAFYSQTLAASGGSPPYTWSLLSGTLPLGLSLSSNGAITGIPTATGTSYFFVVRVTDTASASATQTFLLSVSTSTGPSFIGSMPHIAAEENWITTFTLVNKQTAPAQAQLNFFGDAADPSGNGPLVLPVTLPQQSSAAQPSSTSSFSQTISANASLIVQTAGPQTPPVQVGSAQLAATGAVDGFAIFHLIPGAQEAVVPMETRNASSYLLAYDNTGGVVLGVAVANVSAQAGSVGVVVRDDTGILIGSGSLAMSGNGHTSFVLSALYPETAGKRGTIQFNTPAGGQISVLGIRTTPLGNSTTLTSVPALANVGTNGGS
ncbi:MAG TPA: SBBP repeat-containing protein, partial [Bryobacteraceae bacterium]|nr:SBBP repeat-containing protein [Bryobacteraceae bacterium]